MASTDDQEPIAAPRSVVKRELLVGLVCAAIFAVFGLMAQGIRARGLAAVGIGPNFFPTALAIVGAALALLYCVAVILDRPQATPEPTDPDEGAFSFVRPAMVLLAPLAWALALPHAGFVISTWVLLTVLFLLFDGRTQRAWLIVPSILTLVLWLLFDVVLGVSLPAPAFF